MFSARIRVSWTGAGGGGCCGGRLGLFGRVGLVGLEVHDKNGNVSDVTHGYDTLAGWIADTAYFGPERPLLPPRELAGEAPGERGDLRGPRLLPAVEVEPGAAVAVVEENQVDIARIVQFHAAQLAHGHGDKGDGLAGGVPHR